MKLHSQTIYDEITEILSYLMVSGSVNTFLRHADNSTVEVGDRAHPLCAIDKTSLTLAGGKEIGMHIATSLAPQLNVTISLAKQRIFFDNISTAITRLNHVGIGYYCGDIDKEIAMYKKMLEGTGFNIYEEASDIKDKRWIFIGDADNWEAPLFELVLSQGKQPLRDSWTPHFQIDLDTNLTPSELETLANKRLRKDFWTWKLEIKNYGVVLKMGRLCAIGGVGLYLGLGTNLRNTQQHRARVLQGL